jgi:hypothetical protein
MTPKRSKTCDRFSVRDARALLPRFVDHPSATSTQIEPPLLLVCHRCGAILSPDYDFKLHVTSAAERVRYERDYSAAWEKALLISRHCGARLN